MVRRRGTGGGTSTLHFHSGGPAAPPFASSLHRPRRPSVLSTVPSSAIIITTTTTTRVPQPPLLPPPQPAHDYRHECVGPTAPSAFSICRLVSYPSASPAAVHSRRCAPRSSPFCRRRRPASWSSPDPRQLCIRNAVLRASPLDFRHPATPRLPVPPSVRSLDLDGDSLLILACRGSTRGRHRACITACRAHELRCRSSVLSAKAASAYLLADIGGSLPSPPRPDHHELGEPVTALLSPLPQTRHLPPTNPPIPPSCLPQFSSSEPSPTTREPARRAEEASTSTWPTATMVPAGGDRAASSRCITSPPRRSSRSVIRRPCPISTPTGPTQKVILSLFFLPRRRTGARPRVAAC